MIEFGWDESKARRNLREYKVSFEEAQSVVYDDYVRQFYDEQRSQAEDSTEHSLSMRFCVRCYVAIAQCIVG